jgi:hypothetical protein
MDNSIYKAYKERLKAHADSEKGTDKPYRRQYLNDTLDNELRSLDRERLQERISEKQYNLYSAWLTNYCIERHEK